MAQYIYRKKSYLTFPSADSEVNAKKFGLKTPKAKEEKIHEEAKSVSMLHAENSFLLFSGIKESSKVIHSLFSTHINRFHIFLIRSFLP